MTIDFFKNATTTTNIQRLEWSSSSKKEILLNQAKAPKGWRLPTVNELYTLLIKNPNLFLETNSTYWTSDFTSQNYPWVVSFGFVSGVCLCVDSDKIKNKTVFVKEI